MAEIIKTIKDLAHRVSEDYLLFGKDMNDSLISLYEKGEIENSEILKRICEQANQNVYLALFHNPDTNKSNITFDLAEFDRVSEIANESEEAMKDYNTPPDDFRSNLEIAVISNKTEDEEKEKVASLGMVVEHRQVLRNLLNRVGIMKVAEYESAENSFNNMASDTEKMISNGESIGDIAKIATRYVKEDLEGDFVKVASCYDFFHKQLGKKSKVRSGFTKLSSQRINSKNEILSPVKEFTHSIAKIAGLEELEENIKKVLEVFDHGVKKNI